MDPRNRQTPTGIPAEAVRDSLAGPELEEDDAIQERELGVGVHSPCAAEIRHEGTGGKRRGG
ncbi:MAG: hypothetical protein L3J96_06890 [Thermoplasmata archaeon]|nr:hypothetical protein [Thermoplasmata archaeon]